MTLLVHYFHLSFKFFLIGLEAHDVGKCIHQGLFLLHLYFLHHRSPSFPPFPVCLLPLLSFKNIPASPSISSFAQKPSQAHVSALFYYSFHPSLLSSASQVLLFTCTEFWSLEFIKKLLQTAHFFPPTIPLSLSYIIQPLFSSVIHSCLLNLSLFSNSWAFHFWHFP